MSYLGLWSLNVLLVSSAIALFEINLEKDHGWASGLAQSGLGRRLWKDSVLARMIEKPYVTVYHLVLFGVIVPLILIGQYSIFRDLWITSRSEVIDGGVLTAWQVGSLHFTPLLSGIAAWFAITTVEDFLWFALNWHYPSSLADLLAGRIWWHTRWVTIGKIKLPRFYVGTVVLSGVFLCGSIHPRMNWTAAHNAKASSLTAITPTVIK